MSPSRQYFAALARLSAALEAMGGLDPRRTKPSVIRAHALAARKALAVAEVWADEARRPPAPRSNVVSLAAFRARRTRAS